jgi:hypothetical protein
VLKYNTQTYALIDFVTYFYSYSEQTWKNEYNSPKTYGKAVYNAGHLKSVFDSIETDVAIRKKFIKYYDVSNRDYSPITESNWRPYWCGIGRLSEADFNECTLSADSYRLRERSRP